MTMVRYWPRLARPLAAVAFLGISLPLAAQVDPYEARYGATVDVSIDDLLQMPESYAGKAVRTRGRLEVVPAARQMRYSMRGTFGGRVFIMPARDLAFDFDTNALSWVGREVEVTGLFGDGNDPDTGQRAFVIAAWAFVGPPDEKAAKGPVTDATLEELITRAGRLDGKVVRVRGQFRGQNLFGDLPSASRRRSSDWVIKQDLFAAWVTGRKPKGSGWSFDAGLRRDTGKWLEVVGRVSTVRGVVTLDAREVTLVADGGASRPESQATAAPSTPPPPKPKQPPVVVFSLPLDGEREVPPGTVFKVQFSRDMDESSFAGRVLLRYAGRAQPGDRDLDAVRWSYDGGLRTLNVDPGDLLRPGRVVELVLLPGIVDLDGLELVGRPSVRPAQGLDVLRFQIAQGLALGGSSR